MVCLETDFMVELLRNGPKALTKLEALKKLEEELTITPITLTELFKGAYKAKTDIAILQVEEMTAGLVVLNYDLLSAKKSGELLNSLEREGSVIGDFDTITGAICHRYGESLITKNKKHFSRIKGLKIEDW